MKIDRKNRILFFIIILFLIGTSIALVQTAKIHQNENRKLILINAIVNLDDGKITITNKDSFDYVNTELNINNHYKIIGFNLPAGESSILWQVEFSNYSGRRMGRNEKAITFSIACDLYNGENGVYYTKFNKSK